MSFELIIVAIVVALIFVLRYVTKKGPPTEIDDKNSSSKSHQKDNDDKNSSSRIRQLTNFLNTRRVITIVVILIVGGAVCFNWSTLADIFTSWFMTSWLGAKSGLTKESVRSNLWMVAVTFAVILVPMVWIRYTKKSNTDKSTSDPVGTFFGLIVLLVGSTIALTIAAIPLLILSIMAKEFGVFDSIENIVRIKNDEVSCTTQGELTSISRKGGFYSTETLNICPTRGKLSFSGNKVLFRISPDFVKKYALKGENKKVIESFMRIRFIGGQAYHIEPLPLKSGGGYISMYERLGVDSVPLEVIPHWDNKSP